MAGFENLLGTSLIEGLSRGGGGEGPLVGSRLKFFIFVGCLQISVNKKNLLLIINIFYVFSTHFQDFDP